MLVVFSWCSCYLLLDFFNELLLFGALLLLQKNVTFLTKECCFLDETLFRKNTLEMIFFFDETVFSQKMFIFIINYDNFLPERNCKIPVMTGFINCSNLRELQQHCNCDRVFLGIGKTF